MKYILDYEKYEECAIRAIAEGQVLLENRNNVLPIKKGSRLAVFGRMQNNYYKSGTGSGGMVNVNRVYSILDALYIEEEAGYLSVNPKLAKIYKDFEIESPYVEGKGWGNEKWSQEEMELSDKVVEEASRESDLAVVIIARSSGEDQDNKNEEGSYLLTKKEKDMLSKVRSFFDRMLVLLNVGNIMDMSFIKELGADAVLYAWQGGMLGGIGTVKALTGEIPPSGHLTDTIAKSIDDYPSTPNFGDPDEVIYKEDIFVGYRYFESFSKDKVLYPFGYGLTYTKFDKEVLRIDYDNNVIKVRVKIKNTGEYKGRELVAVYVEAPNGRLGKAKRVLAGFLKTKELQKGEEELLNIDVEYKNFASFDERGICSLGTGFVLEKGEYSVCIGSDVRSAVTEGTFIIKKDILVEGLSNALGPVKPFKRFVACLDDKKNLMLCHEDAPLRLDTQRERRDKNLPKNLEISGDKGIKLIDVKEKRASLEDFVSQLSEKELCSIIRNAGMSSPLVTPGTAAAFGGITPSLKEKGIPVGCMDDGPSGMRLDSGMKAFSLPNGTLLASTFDVKINEELFTFLGIEMLKNRVDVLLGPGMNIHRNPLNGRNFEYFSEDPLLTGLIASAQLKGLQSVGVTGTIKHFACNNQEIGRQKVNPVVSERALREIYLKGFEIAVKNGADAVMTTYCKINGVYTAGSYDLNTTILREEWGFKGIVMTDWWANISDEASEGSKTNFAAMIRAQNDLYACTPDGLCDVGDNAYSSLLEGSLCLGELQRSAMNISSFLMKYAVMDRFVGNEIELEILGAEEGFDESPSDIEYILVGSDGSVDLSQVEVKKGQKHYFGIEVNSFGSYKVYIEGRGLEGNDLAQIPIVLYVAADPVLSFVYNGTGEWTTQSGDIILLNNRNVLHLYFGINGIELKSIRFVKNED